MGAVHWRPPIGSVWVALAVFQWLRDDADAWMRWSYTPPAVMHVVVGFFWGRLLRRPLPPLRERRTAPDR